MKIKKTLKNLTEKEYKKWFMKHCTNPDLSECKNCPLKRITTCNPYVNCCWIYNKDCYSNNFLNQEIEIDIEMKLTKEEKIILKNFNRGWYKYLVRDKNGKLYVFMEKPNKCNEIWGNSGLGFERFAFDSIFNCITWENDEPVLIEDLLKESE